MVKLIGLVKRKAGMSREAFQEYYEAHHAPLVMRRLPVGHDYRRNYTILMRVEGREVESDPDYDAISEMWFADEPAYRAFAEAMLDPAVRGAIVRDEENFLDRSATRILLVEECSSPAR